MDEVNGVPIIDFSAYSLGRENADEEGIKTLSSAVYKALTTVGFMYLNNCGLAPELVEDAFRDSKKFFDLPPEVKTQFGRSISDWHGYVGFEREGTNRDVPFNDLKEAFNYLGPQTEPFPADVPPEFRRSLQKLFAESTDLQNRILEVMGRGLGLEDPLLFVKGHSRVGDSGNKTQLRTCYYPPLSGVTINKGQARCGDHTDWGGISLIFQDDHPGLEVKNLEGKWVAVTPKKGTIVLIMADTIQRWTADVYKSSYHRVRNPQDDAGRQQARQSFVYFGNPNEDTIIKCIDNSDKYPTMKHSEFFAKRANDYAT